MEEDKWIILARVAERAERYDEMAEYMTERVKSGPPFTDAEERDMFSAAFKNMLSGRRSAVRVTASVAAQEEELNHPENAERARNYQSKVEAELKDICGKALSLLKENLVPGAAPGEPKTFFLKMQGDYHRYLAEVALADAKLQAAQEAKECYETGTNEASGLPTTHPVRLGLALNFSVFQHEVLGDTASAVLTAKTALEGAVAEVANVDQASQQESILSMQLLQDNLALWEQP
jgi:14-3-3 protein epsilon